MRRPLPLALLLLAAAVAARAEAPGAAPASASAPPPARVQKSLAECIEIALRNHPALGSAAASVEGGRARVRQSIAGYLPQVDSSYAVDRRKTTTAARIGTPGAGGGSAAQKFTYFSSGVSLSQVLFDFGRNLDAIQAARAGRESLVAAEDVQREAVAFDVKQSYFDLLAARRLLSVAEQTLRSAQKQAEQAQGRFQVGLAAKIDVTRSQVELANAELDRVTARNNVAVAEQTLRNALGLRGPLEFEPVDVLELRPVTPREAEALAVAYEHRPELRSLAAQQRAKQEEISSLRKQHLPVVNGNAVYQWTGSEHPLDRSWDVGAVVTLPLTDGGRTTAQVAEARASLRGLAYDEEAQRQDIALEVRQAVLALAEAEERISVSERAAQQARENLELAEGRYRTGVGNVIELTDAQATRASAEADRVRALYSYRIAVATLERATGRPLETP